LTRERAAPRRKLQGKLRVMFRLTLLVKSPAPSLGVRGQSTKRLLQSTGRELAADHASLPPLWLLLRCARRGRDARAFLRSSPLGLRRRPRRCCSWTSIASWDWRGVAVIRHAVRSGRSRADRIFEARETSRQSKAVAGSNDQAVGGSLEVARRSRAAGAVGKSLGPRRDAAVDTNPGTNATRTTAQLPAQSQTLSADSRNHWRFLRCIVVR
jgi:hypothetical protein